MRTKHPNIRSAEIERDLRIEMEGKYPFIMPRSKNEIARCKRLKLPVTYPYRSMETGEVIEDPKEKT